MKKEPQREDEALMQNLIASFNFVGRMHAIRCALYYDLSDLPQADKAFTGAAGRMWQALMNTWNAVHGR